MNHRVPAHKRYQPTEYEHAANCATHAVSWLWGTESCEGDASRWGWRGGGPRALGDVQSFHPVATPQVARSASSVFLGGASGILRVGHPSKLDRGTERASLFLEELSVAP